MSEVPLQGSGLDDRVYVCINRLQRVSGFGLDRFHVVGFRVKSRHVWGSRSGGWGLGCIVGEGLRTFPRQALRTSTKRQCLNVLSTFGDEFSSKWLQERAHYPKAHPGMTLGGPCVDCVSRLLPHYLFLTSPLPLTPPAPTPTTASSTRRQGNPRSNQSTDFQRGGHGLALLFEGHALTFRSKP